MFSKTRAAEKKYPRQEFIPTGECDLLGRGMDY